MWDWSGVLPDNAFPGVLLKGLFGYNADPSVLEVFAYAAYVVGIVWVRRRMMRAPG
jgi:high-affinity Fe2+/Pb2+ permease